MPQLTTTVAQSASTKLLTKMGADPTETSSVSIIDLLADLTLKEPHCIDILGDVLKRTACRFEPREVEDIYSPKIKYKFSAILNGQYRCLLDFPEQILLLDFRKPDDAISALNRLRETIEKRCPEDARETDSNWDRILYLVLPPDFSQDKCNKSFYRMTRIWEAHTKIGEVKFLSSTLAFSDVDTIMIDLKLQKTQTRDLLGKLKQEDRVRLETIISHLEVFTDPATRRGFLIAIEGFLEWIDESVVLSGPSKDVAGALVAELLNRTMQGKDNSFGKFLNHMLQPLCRLGDEEEIFIERLINEFNL